MITIILIYGIKFDDELDTTTEWLLTCGIALALDVFVQQPLSVGFATFIGQFDLGVFGDIMYELVCCGLPE